MGRSSPRTVTPFTGGCVSEAKAPSLWKDWSKGTQRTRKLSTGGRLGSWRNAKERFVGRMDHGEGTEGVKPSAVKAASSVLNGGDEETGLVRPRLVATQLECGQESSPDEALARQKQARHTVLQRV